MAYIDPRELSYTAAERASGTQKLNIYGNTTQYIAPKKKKRVLASKPKQVVVEAGDDFGSIAEKLGVDTKSLVMANPNDSTAKAGTMLNVPPGVGAGAGVGDYLWEELKRFGRMVSPWDEESGETFQDWAASLPGGKGAEGWIGWDEQSSLPPGVGYGAGNFGLGGTQPSPDGGVYIPEQDPRDLSGILESEYSKYNQPSADPRSLTVEEGVYGSKTQAPVGKNAGGGQGMWEGHDYWSGHVDPYRLAIDLAGGINNLPPHPSENINDYMRSGDFASNYLRDVRAWEDTVYGGQRQNMIDIVRNDPVLSQKLFNDELTTGDLLEIHREFPAYVEQYGFEIRDQMDVDMLVKLGYLDPQSGGYGGYGYTPYSYSPSRSVGRGAQPYRGNSASFLSLTSWSI